MASFGGHDGRQHKFRARQQQAFAEERRRWAEQGEFSQSDENEAGASASNDQDTPAGVPNASVVHHGLGLGIQTASGDTVDAGQRVLILEAMKMEIAVHAPRTDEIVQLLCEQGLLVTAGQPLLVYRPHE